MAHPDWDRQFLLQTDASDIALGAVLSQEDENRDLRVCLLFEAAAERRGAKVGHTRKGAARCCVEL